MNKIILIIFTMILIGCKERPPKVKGIYTIWIGGDIVQSGYDTNKYHTDGCTISFINLRNGKSIVAPMSNVGSIEEN